MKKHEKTMSPAQMTKIRGKLGLSQSGLAKALDCSERFILYRESGVRPIDLMLQNALENLLRKKEKSR